ncbi:MAG TPA: beta-ketoacyl-ACP synthase II [Nitrospirota bacterium]|nr:beta-ketoacyl-ACP synthase II [Nitrospirota bacterium]
MKRRVVVTGIGLVTPLGTGVEKTWQSLCEGKSGIGRITRFDPSELPSQIAAEVKDFDPADFIEKKEIKKMDRFIQFGIAAAKMAVEDAGIEITEATADRAGVYVGAGIGGLPAIESNHIKFLEGGIKKLTPFFIPMVIINLVSGHIAIMVGAKGPNSAVATACATGTHAIGDAFKIIQRGDADIMIAGGTESTISPLAVGGFCAMRALSVRNDAPEKASRPFDAMRDGFVIGEGAGVVILEELTLAEKRGAKIYAEVCGYGMTGDAYHITSPAPEGVGAARCMNVTLKDAGLYPDDISYINAHGTSTKFNDENETSAIKEVFGKRAHDIPVSSTKSMTGHLLGAAGGIEAVFSVLSIEKGVIPPTVNYEFPDPECDLDYVPNKSRAYSVDVALSNSFGFGGTNACILFRKFKG